MAQGGLLLLHIALNLGLDSVIVPLHTMPLIPVVVSVVVEQRGGGSGAVESEIRSSSRRQALFTLVRLIPQILINLPRGHNP